MAADDFDTQVEGIASLGEPVRRALYQYVAGQPVAVSRDDAATAVGVPRHTAKFHLDKLVEDGLVDVEFARPPGRRGPGAGRPAKLYRRAARELAVSLPARHYDLAGRLLARAVEDAATGDIPVAEALAGASRQAGRSLGEDVRRRLPKRASRAALTRAATDALRECGYEPHDDDAGIYLANCPFHSLAQDFTGVVCGMNHDFIEGVLDALDGSGLTATLAPEPGRCCVRLRGRSPGA